MTDSILNCGKTELWMETQKVSWEVSGIDSFLHPKVLPALTIRSPYFHFPCNPRHWCLELVLTKPDFLKCILRTCEGAPEQVSSNINIGSSGDGTPLSQKRSEEIHAAANSSLSSGAILNDMYILTADGRHESFAETREKYEETQGWREWAGKFVEKRRKSGLTEYIFGVDTQAYENAFPWLYVFEHKHLYIVQDKLRLEAELIFTGSSQNPLSPDASTLYHSLVERHISDSNKALAQRLCGFYNTSTYSDLTLLCDCRVFPIHRIVIEARAPTLAENLFNRPAIFQNNQPNEEASSGPNEEVIHHAPQRPNVIKVEDISATVLDIVLRFAYSGKLPETLSAEMLVKVSQEARKLTLNDLLFHCFLKALESHRRCTGASKSEFTEVLKDIFSNKDGALITDPATLSDLRKMYPEEFIIIDISRDTV